MSTRYKAKRILSITLRIGVSFALLVFLFKQIDKKALLGILASANIWLLAGAFFIFLFTYIISLYRWEMLLKAVKVHLSIKRIIVSFSAGLFFNLFLPATIGGDLVRSFDLATHTKKPKEIIASVLLERISGYAGLVLVALVALFYGYGLFRDKTVIFIIGLITLLLIAVLLVLFNNFFFGKIKEIILDVTVVDFGRSFSRKLQEVTVEIQITLYRFIAVFPRDKLTSKVFKLEFRRYRRFVLAGKSPLAPLFQSGES